MPDLPDLVLQEDLVLLTLASEEELPEDLLAQDLVDALQYLDVPQLAQDLVDVPQLAQDLVDVPQLVQDLVDLVVDPEELDRLQLVLESAKPHLAQDSVVSAVRHLPDHLDLASRSAYQADLALLKALVVASVEYADLVVAMVATAPAEEPAVATVVIEALTANNNNPVTVREGPVDMEAEAMADLLTIEEIDFLTVYICAIREIVSANFLATISLSF